MKLLLLLSLVLFNATTQAKNYYISATGNNSNSGLSPNAAWQSIAKVNSSFGSFAAGDSILFKSGETFSGSIKVSKSGTSSSPIVISSYGTGARPIISGFVTLTAWMNVGGNIWECSAGTLKNDVNILTINETPYAVGRTPNTSYYTYQSASGSQMTSSQLGGASYVGAEAVIRKIAYVAERVKITAQSGSTITYAKTNTIDPATSNTPQNGNANYGFFLQRFSSSLDQFGEWYFNTTTKKMQIYSTGNPSGYTIKASYVDTLIAMNNMTNIVASNLSLEGAGRSAVFSKDGSNIKIKNCDFNNNTRPVNVHNTLNIVVDNCTMNNSFNNAIYILNNHTKQITITNTIINNTGQLMGMGAFWSEANLKGIFVEADTISTSANFVNIIGNVVKNTGSSGIQFQGSNVILRRNLVENFCNLLDDGGGIYTWLGGTSTSPVHLNRIIDSNMILNSNGAPDGAGGHADVVGYFQDREGKNIIGKNNTIANIAGNGFQSTNPSNHVFNNNTIYNCAVAININKYPHSEISKLSIKGNIIYQKDSSQFNFLHTNNNLNLPTVMTAAQSLTNQWDMDSNWVSNMKYAGYQYYTSTNGSTYTFPPKLALTQWQNTYANDQHSVLPKVALTATNTRFEYNATNVAKTISITGQSYIDPKGNVYNNTVTIPAWSSIILIKNGVSSNQSPVANAGIAKVITLPVNTTSLTGSGTDADGSISSYAWVKVSGPSPGTIATANTATTAVNNLVQGVYQYELTVTDNNGATGKGTVLVTVNAAPNQSPIANAGTAKVITLPINTTSLTGSGTDTDGTISSYAWVKISGPSSGTIATASAATTAVNSLMQGVYQYELTVTDNNGATGKGTVQVTVNAAPNQSPMANAGTAKVITLPINTTSLTGSGTDTDGTISSYAWVKISGPSSGTIATANAAATAVNSLMQGVYQYELTVTDNNGATGKSTVQVTVNAAANKAPVANAGTDNTITLPVNNSSLTGSGTDPDGTINSYAWVKISGPSAGTIATANAATTAVNGLVQGVYQYQLTVTDNNGTIGKDTVQLTVNTAPNQAPVANAGTDKIITLPLNNITLTGSATDADGTIAGYGWSKVSGPAGTIISITSATTLVNSLVQGVYQFKLTSTDNLGAIATDQVQVTVNMAPNVPPTANAGVGKTITLPANSISLAGTGADTDGTIVSYLWTKISGPAGGTISSANSATTAITALMAGTYSFQLRVTDNAGATATATTQVIVNAAFNILPMANAGSDKVILFPTNTTTLTGSGSDADGTISSYAWVKISGPSSGTIATGNTATTAVNNLVQGVYQYQLTVSDNNGATGKDTVQVTVNAATNQAPLSNAGSDKSIILPTNTTTLTGSGSDADGAISSYAWVKISGPSSGTIATGNTATTAVNNLVQGVYQYQLTVTDNSGATGKDTVLVTVNAATNQAPLSNAGPDKAIILPANTTTLTGSGSDADGTISSYAWVKISGPSSGTIATGNTATTAVNNLVQGVYQYQLTVSDNNGATGKDTVLVTVNAASNQAPLSNAGSDKSIILPTNTTTLTGSGSDADGAISSYAWVKISGPSSGTIATGNTATTAVNSLVQGVYQYQLTVTDNNGATGKDTVLVTVNSASNQAPLSNAGSDKAIILPTNTTTLTGSATDADGAISSYAWVKISGPSSGTIGTGNTATTTVNNLVQGVYQYQLTVTDNNGATGKDTVLVTVNSASNQAPLSNAGSDKAMILPTNTTTLTGSGTDADGAISSYAWVKISGPSSGTIATGNTATTAVNSLVLGVYQYQLTVSDNNGATGKDTVLVTVNSASNQAPLSNAGSDKAIILPTNTTTLTGSATDADGAISSYTWVKISGPSSGTIGTGNTATTTVNNLVQGVYQYQLTVTDNNGATGKDTVQVTVNAATNQVPLSNAGSDKVVILPTNTITLTGSGTDADGTISSYTWVKISGPSPGMISTINAATTAVNSLVQGVYQYELTVTDNSGANGKDTVQVTVNIAQNQAPLSNAGTDIAIILPINTVTLTGTGADTDGTISSYAWVKISGPSSGTIATASTATTLINNMVQGVYQYELTVTDNNGANGKDTVQVTINAAGNQAPVSNAGSDIVITLPINTVSLTGSGSDGDGVIIIYAWSKISGPSSGKIVTAFARTTAVNNLVAGIYQYQLTVMDNKGSMGKDTVQVTVNQSGQARVSNARTDKITTLPINATSLNEFNVYPNPVGDIANLNISNAKGNNKASVSVVDQMGKLVKYMELLNLKSISKFKLDMSNLKNGFYIIIVRFEDGQRLSSKVVKYGGK